jgi:hypothetical protein
MAADYSGGGDQVGMNPFGAAHRKMGQGDL